MGVGLGCFFEEVESEPMELYISPAGDEAR